MRVVHADRILTRPYYIPNYKFIVFYMKGTKFIELQLTVKTDMLLAQAPISLNNDFKSFHKIVLKSSLNGYIHANASIGMYS